MEHGDKGRVELNFVIRNTELLTGKRLQPYSDRANRPRIDAWQTIVNARLGLHDPNALRLVSKTWIYVILSLLLIFAVSWSSLWYTGRLISQNMAEIQAQNVTLSKLEQE